MCMISIAVVGTIEILSFMSAVITIFATALPLIQFDSRKHLHAQGSAVEWLKLQTLDPISHKP